MPVHEQVTMPDGVKVDAGTAGLLTAMWKLNLRTSHSCQGTPRSGEGEDDEVAQSYISFPHAADAFEFFSQTLAATSTPDSRAQVVVTVRLLARAGPGWELRKRGPVVSIELDVPLGAKAPDLRGCVRFNPELMPLIEDAYAVVESHATHDLEDRV